MKPVRLQPNLVDHFYAGGARIAALRGIETTSDHQPEEWIAATVSRAGEPGVGLARTVDERRAARPRRGRPVGLDGSRGR